MNNTAFTCKKIIERFKTRWLVVPQKYVYLKPGLKVLVGLGVASGIPSVSAQNDSNSVNRDDTIDTGDSDHKFDNNAGWERLKAVYKRDDYGSLSKEITACIQSTCTAFFIGCVYGGIGSSRVAFRDFMERNQATIFENHLDAKRRLQNHVTIHFGKGALRWGIKLSVFNAGFMLFLTSLLAYRGRTNVMDYMISGTIVGGLLKLRLGPRGFLVGGTVGCVLGAFCGLTTQGLFYITGTSLDDVISFQYELDQRRLKLFKQMEAKETEKRHFDPQTVNMLKLHDESEKLTKKV